jgi:UDP-glucuronate decarboxylase
MDPDDGRVVSNFIVRTLRDEPLVVYGDGQKTRSFSYVDNLIQGLVQLMESDAEVPGPINPGNPGEFTMKALAELILELTGSKSEIVHAELPADDPVRRCPAISRAEQVLDWHPALDLRDGLPKTISYFETLLGARRWAEESDSPMRKNVERMQVIELSVPPEPRRSSEEFGRTRSLDGCKRARACP